MSAKASWWLERIAADGSALAVPVHALPFGIGRDEDNELVLIVSGVSRRHARLTKEAGGDRLVLSDLGSTNGCFVNRVRIEAPRALEESDIVHIGSAELRIRRADSGLLDSVPPGEERTVIALPGRALSELSHQELTDLQKWVRQLWTIGGKLRRGFDGLFAHFVFLSFGGECVFG